MKTLMGGFMLLPHPDSPPAAVKGVSGSAIITSAGRWNLGFTVECPDGKLSLPEPEAPRRMDELWKTTCFELFLRNSKTGAYLEFNLSPSGHWAAYSFDGYREGMRDLAIPPIAVTTSNPQQFALAMRAKLCAMGIAEDFVEEMLALEEPAQPPAAKDCFALTGILEDHSLQIGADCEIAISAVIEETDGTKSYWALAHPAGKPDFHHPTCFAATLPPPEIT